MLTIQRQHKSPYHNARPAHAIVNTIILHSDVSATVASTIEYLCNPAEHAGVSYHCIVGRLGDVYELVDPNRRAWHAGTSSFQGVPDCNNYSVGVCLSNKQDGVEPYTEAALRACAEYCAYLMGEHPAITLDRITMHSTVATPLGRKSDPAPSGPFDLQQFIDMVADVRAATMHV